MPLSGTPNGLPRRSPSSRCASAEGRARPRRRWAAASAGGAVAGLAGGSSAASLLYAAPAPMPPELLAVFSLIGAIIGAVGAAGVGAGLAGAEAVARSCAGAWASWLSGPRWRARRRGRSHPGTLDAPGALRPRPLDAGWWPRRARPRRRAPVSAMPSRRREREAEWRRRAGAPARSRLSRRAPAAPWRPSRSPARGDISGASAWTSSRASFESSQAGLAPLRPPLRRRRSRSEDPSLPGGLRRRPLRRGPRPRPHAAAHAARLKPSPPSHEGLAVEVRRERHPEELQDGRREVHDARASRWRSSGS